MFFCFLASGSYAEGCSDSRKIPLNKVVRRFLQLQLLSLDKIIGWIYGMFSVLLIGVKLRVQKSFSTNIYRKLSPQ